MTALERALIDVASALDALGRPWALVGGLAVAVRAEPRLTRDVDVAVAVESDDEAERVVRELAAVGYRPVALVEHGPTGRLATARLAKGSVRSVVTDLLFASCGIEGEVAYAAERIEILPGVEAPVARLGHLMAMKVLARDDRSRPADADDLVALVAEASEADWAIALDAAQMIVARGFDRGRDLVAALDELRLEPGSAGSSR